MPRLRVYGVSAAFLVLVASPAFRDPPRDSFPLSDFPMFSHGRPSPRFHLTHALAVGRDGARRPISPWVATQNREVLQAMVWLQAAARDAARSCAEIAGRVAAAAQHREAVAVELVTSDLDAVAYFAGRQEPLQRTVHARCAVPR